MTDPTPADERRERYKTALLNIRIMRDGKNLDRRVDAVTAVADKEIARAIRDVTEELASKVETVFACTGFHGNGCSTADCCGIHAEAVAHFLRTGVKRDDY